MEDTQTQETNAEGTDGGKSAKENVDMSPTPEYPTTDVTPDWVKLPGELDIPTGAPVGFIKFKAEWTVAPQLGVRQCIVWPLTDLDERVAYARVRENIANAANELAKQMLRAVDGVRCNWGAKPGEPGNPHDFWRDIGPKCRALCIRYYNRMHSLDAAEVAYFLENCVEVRTMG